MLFHSVFHHSCKIFFSSFSLATQSTVDDRSYILRLTATEAAAVAPSAYGDVADSEAVFNGHFHKLHPGSLIPSLSVSLFHSHSCCCYINADVPARRELTLPPDRDICPSGPRPVLYLFIYIHLLANKLSEICKCLSIFLQTLCFELTNLGKRTERCNIPVLFCQRNTNLSIFLLPLRLY